MLGAAAPSRVHKCACCSTKLFGAKVITGCGNAMRLRLLFLALHRVDASFNGFGNQQLFLTTWLLKRLHQRFKGKRHFRSAQNEVLCTNPTDC